MYYRFALTFYNSSCYTFAFLLPTADSRSHSTVSRRIRVRHPYPTPKARACNSYRGANPDNYVWTDIRNSTLYNNIYYSVQIINLTSSGDTKIDNKNSLGSDNSQECTTT